MYYRTTVADAVRESSLAVRDAQYYYLCCAFKTEFIVLYCAKDEGLSRFGPKKLGLRAQRPDC